MAEINPPLYVPVSLAYGADELALPFRDIMGEGIVSATDLAVTQRGAGANRSVDVAAGAFWAKGDDDAAAQGCYRGRSTGVVNLAVAANASGNPRIDLIVAHVRDATFAGALNSWALEVLQGAPTAGATLANALGAAAVPNNTIVLARVLCANGFATITNAEILDMRARALVGAGVASVKGGAQVATRISDLPAATDGMIARIRIMPATFNNGGATALPAATITVGDTTDFPTAGTVETANGNIAYTGKTATTLTGCTGGTGTLAANAVIRLIVGTPASGSFDEVTVIYSATVGKWIGTDVYRHTMKDNTAWNANIGGLNTWTETTQPNGAQSDQIPVIKWRALDAAGLKPQVRHGGGSVYAANAGTNQWRPSFRSLVSRATLTYTNIGGDANAAGEVGAMGASSRAVGGTPWGSIPAYTLADLFAPGLQAQQLSGALGAQLISGTIEVRWVG